ncbi:MAG: glycosyltransferase family 39 protein [Acidobacteriota bacterium]|nr:glycosyltransferase family 39 protein [Acidobacteriota bacterium]
MAGGLPALRYYNVTWDEALGDFFFGERYLSFFTSLDPAYLDFSGDPYPAGHAPDLDSPFRDHPWEYYPVTNTLAAAASMVTSRWLGLLDPFDGFHAINLPLVALLVVALFEWMRRYYDSLAAVVACGLLLTSPRLVVHALSNIKDTPEMVFFSLALLAFGHGWQRGSARWIVAAGLVWGLALGTKANAIFVPPIALATVLVATTPEGLVARLRKLWPALGGSIAAGSMLFLASWPYVWPHPIERLSLHLDYIGLRLFATRPESIASPIGAVLFTTPLPFLALVTGGLVVALVRRSREVRWVLPIAWIGVVVGRLYLPNAVNFDGVRHFLEAFPAFAILAGAAASSLRDRVVDSVAAPRRVTAVGICLVALLPGIWATARSHPFQLGYWNTLAGGLAGARASGQPQAGDYWGTSYRLGLEWLSRHAPRQSVLAVPLMQHTVTLVLQTRLRVDIDLLDISRHEVPDIRPETFTMLDEVSRQRPVYVMFAVRDDWTNPLIEHCRQRLEPVARWSLESEPILLIYRW